MDFEVHLMDGENTFSAFGRDCKRETDIKKSNKNMKILQFDETNDYHRSAVHFAKPGN